MGNNKAQRERIVDLSLCALQSAAEEMCDYVEVQASVNARARSGRKKEAPSAIPVCWLL